MYNQIEAILSQYELEIHEVTKGRGAYICDTDKGKKLLIGFRGSKEKGEFLKIFLSRLKEQGFYVEQIEVNKAGEAVTKDEGTGEHFILKDYLSGAEFNTGHLEDVKAAAALLAEYHNASAKVDIHIFEKMTESIHMIASDRKRHYRELVKVRNYIRGRKKKNEFEQIYMKHYEPMLQTAEESIRLLEQQESEHLKGCICHGDYNQHNVVWYDRRWRIINFEGFTYSWSVLDLANFLRKMLEKNDWDVSFGMEVLHSYRNVRELSKREFEQLYGLLLFPEKFWKVTNHYMNSRKTWISERDIEKLKKVIEQEGKRLNFMENLFSIEKE